MLTPCSRVRCRHCKRGRNESLARVQAEARRLGAILSAFPTTQAQDEAQLDAGLDDEGRPADWQTRHVIQFRIQRKRALRCGVRQAATRSCVQAELRVVLTSDPNLDLSPLMLHAACLQPAKVCYSMPACEAGCLACWQRRLLKVLLLHRWTIQRLQKRHSRDRRQLGRPSHDRDGTS